jgi:hypothetical protein
MGHVSLSSLHAQEARRTVTTDLLSVWTDPDTAMHAVGTSLGIFDDRVSADDLGPAESPLRSALLDVLLAIVDKGDLEQRACADGRYAFRWRDDAAASAVATEAVSTRLDAYLAAMPRAMPVILDGVGATRVSVATPVAWIHRAAWLRLVATTAPLLLPTLSCLLALVAFVVLGAAAGIVVLTVLALAGVIGVIRRVPLAGFWTAGLIVAGLLMRLS